MEMKARQIKMPAKSFVLILKSMPRETSAAPGAVVSTPLQQDFCCTWHLPHAEGGNSMDVPYFYVQFARDCRNDGKSA